MTLRLLKKAHVRRRTCARVPLAPGVRRCDVRAEYASRLGGYPSKMGDGACIWTFLSSLSYGRRSVDC